MRGVANRGGAGRAARIAAIGVLLAAVLSGCTNPLAPEGGADRSKASKEQTANTSDKTSRTPSDDDVAAREAVLRHVVRQTLIDNG